MSGFKDLTGQTFDRIYVVKRVDNRNGRTAYLCRCDCRKEKIIRGIDLKNGKVKSCGCLKNEKTIKRSITHGLSRTQLYRVYFSMIGRCYNPNDTHYKDYGGAGIGIDEVLWRDKNGIMDFKEWSFANGYKEELLSNNKNKWTLDRRDNNKGYSKENCRWVTMKVQCNNTSNNHLVTYNEETHTIAEWAEKINLKYDTLFMRLKKGWSAEKALTTPLIINNKKEK